MEREGGERKVGGPKVWVPATSQWPSGSNIKVRVSQLWSNIHKPLNCEKPPSEGNNLYECSSKWERVPTIFIFLRCCWSCLRNSSSSFRKSDGMWYLKREGRLGLRLAVISQLNCKMMIIKVSIYFFFYKILFV